MRIFRKGNFNTVRATLSHNNGQSENEKGFIRTVTKRRKQGKDCH